MNFNYYQMMLVRLGFISDKKLGNENDVILQIWDTLGGEYFGHVTLNNLRIFLLGVMGTHVYPTPLPVD